MIFVTPTIIDPAGNRLHSEDEMPFAKVLFRRRNRPLRWPNNQKCGNLVSVFLVLTNAGSGLKMWVTMWLSHQRVRRAADLGFERIHLKTQLVKRSGSWVARIAASAAPAAAVALRPSSPREHAASFGRPVDLRSGSAFSLPVITSEGQENMDKRMRAC